MHNEQARELVSSRIGLAYSIAAKIHQRTAPQALDIDDMRSWALDGLVQAADNWKSYCESHVPPFSPDDVHYFTAYAQPRIRGNVWDQLRKVDWIPRSVRTRMKIIQKADPELRLSEEELAKITGMSVATIHKTIVETAQKPVSFDSNGISDVLEPKLADVASTAEARRLLKIVVDAIRECPFDQQVVLALHYRVDMQLQNVAIAMGITDAVASALHKAAVMSVFETIKMAVEESY